MADQEPLNEMPKQTGVPPQPPTQPSSPPPLPPVATGEATQPNHTSKIVLILMLTLIAFGFLAGLYYLSTHDESVSGQPTLTGTKQNNDAIEPTASFVAKTSTCQVPVYDDPYAGFAIGKPEGWDLEYADGTIVVTKNPEQTIGVMVYPARLDTDLSARDLAVQFGQAIGGVIQDAGGSYRLVDERGDGNTANLTILAVIDGVELKGPMTVLKESGFVTLKLPFAPSADYAALEGELGQILNCFTRKTGIQVATEGSATMAGPGVSGTTATNAGAAILKKYQGRWFKASLPDGWQVTNENDRGIDIYAPGQVAGVTFAYATGAFGSLSVQDWNSQTLNQAMSGVEVLSSQDLGEPAAGWKAAAQEFEGSINGARVHGVITSMMQNLYGTFSVQTYIKFANTNVWESYKAVLGVVQESIQITSTNGPSSQGVTLPRNNPLDDSSIMSTWENKNASDDRISQGIRTGTMGYDDVRSPSTGETYQVPLNSWDASEGGYVRTTPDGGKELLEVYNGNDYQ